ncbi:MAG: 50S ribosomal protein L21 [Alphaproteobacteria bacterium]
MYAVIKTGGKQYKVAANDVLDVEKLPGEAGETIQFNEVLLVGGEGEAQIGTPLVEGASVAAELVEQHRGEKVIIFKKRRRHNSRRRNGHRQYLTTVRITEILTDGAKAKGAKAKPKAEAAPETKAEAKTAKPKAEKAAANSEGASKTDNGEKAPKAKAPKKSTKSAE